LKAATDKAGPVLLKLADVAGSAWVGVPGSGQKEIALHDNVAPEANTVEDALNLIGERWARSGPGKELFNVCTATIGDPTGRCERQNQELATINAHASVAAYCAKMRAFCDMPDPDYITFGVSVSAEMFGAGMSMTVTRTGQVFVARDASMGAGPPSPVGGSVVATYVVDAGGKRVSGSEVNGFIRGWSATHSYVGNGGTWSLGSDLTGLNVGAGSDYYSASVSYGKHMHDLGADLWR
jgi:hypothetical protein